MSRQAREARAGWWSRAWGWMALLAFAVHLGGAAFEAAVIAPAWTSSPPASVVAWAAMPQRPDSSTFFHPLAALAWTTTTLAWVSSLATPGSRRAWLTLAEAAAVALAWVLLADLVPLESALFDVAEGTGADEALLVAHAGEWLRASALRLAALSAGFLFLLQAHVRASATAVAGAPSAARPGNEASRRKAQGTGPGSRARRDFSFGDDEDEDFFADSDSPPRRRARSTTRARS